MNHTHTHTHAHTVTKIKLLRIVAVCYRPDTLHPTNGVKILKERTWNKSQRWFILTMYLVLETPLSTILLLYRLCLLQYSSTRTQCDGVPSRDYWLDQESNQSCHMIIFNIATSLKQSVYIWGPGKTCSNSRKINKLNKNQLVTPEK